VPIDKEGLKARIIGSFETATTDRTHLPGSGTAAEPIACGICIPRWDGFPAHRTWALSGAALSVVNIPAMSNRSSNRMTGRKVPEGEDSPPPFSTWNRLYVAVIVYTLVLLAALYWMTVALNR